MTTQFAVGSIRCRVLRDGTDAYPPEAVFANVVAAERTAALAGVLDSDGLVPSCYSPLLVESGGELVLVDAGLGEFAEADGAPAGRLASALAEIGISPGDIGHVVISHAHPDHVGGLTVARDAERFPVYEAAIHYVWRAEWDTWTTDDIDVPPDFRDAARMSLLPLGAAGLTRLVDEELEVAPGVRLLAAHGHTPGHAVVELRSGGDTALYLGDAIVHELDVEHDDWLCAFDMNPTETVATRRELLKRAARNSSVVTAFHLAGAGRVTRQGNRFAWTALDER